MKSEGAAALNLSKSEASVFAKYFATQACEVDEMEALGALAGLGLGESGSNNLSYASRIFNDGLVTYRDMVVQEEDKETKSFRAKTVVFHCPSMGEEAPGFARLDLTDVSVTDDEMKFTIGTLNISNPTVNAAAAIISGMIGSNTNDQGDIGFDAISTTKVTFKSEELSGTLTALAWGETRGENGQGKADLTVDDLDVTIPGIDGTQDMTVDFKGMSARNLNIGSRVDPGKNMSPEGVVGTMVGNLNAFAKPYDELIIETMALDSEGFKVDFGGIEGLTTEKDGIITTRQSLKPTVIALKPSLAEIPAFKQNYEYIKTLGFETMKMSGSTVTTLNSSDDSISVSDGLFVVEDGFILNFEYAAEGISEMTAQLQQQTEASSDVMAAYAPLKLRNFRMTLEDNSIVERGLKLATQMTGESENSIKGKLGMAVFAVALTAENELQAEVYSEAVSAFAKFVKKSGTLTLEANPPAPFPLAPLLTGKADSVDPATLGFAASQDGGIE